MKPRGATELQQELLEKFVDKNLLEIKTGTTNTIGMFLIHIGVMKNLDIFFKYLKIDL